MAEKITDAAIVLDELERRIRHQARAAQVGSMEWRAHFADLAHLEAVRMECVAAQVAPSRVPSEESCHCDRTESALVQCPVHRVLGEEA